MTDSATMFAVDRIVDMVPGERAHGVRLVPMSLDIFESHFPRFPVLPGVLILGSVATLAGRMLAPANPQAWTLVGLRRARYRHYVRPGDVVDLHVSVRSTLDGRVTCTARVDVDGSSVATFGSLVFGPSGPGVATGDPAVGRSDAAVGNGAADLAHGVRS